MRSFCLGCLMAKTVSITISAQDNFSAVFQKYNNALGEANSQNSQIASTSSRAGNAMDEMGNAVTNAIVAYAGFKGLQAIGDLFQTGQQVTIVSSTFSQLTRNIGGAAANMDALRQATGGVTNDLTLMQGANKLLQMGLASNTDEMSKLAGMAVKLGSSMGMDATKSMSDFSLMLANNSIMRLDQFGISSGRVRQRMQELQQTMEGIDKNEAFKLAVLEEGQLALDRLGEAATAAETPLNRLQTKLQNIAEGFAGNFAEGVNGAAGIIELAMGQNPIQVAQERQKKQEQTDFSSYYGAMFQQQAAGQGIDLASMFGKQENLDAAITSVFDKFKEQGEGAIDSISQDLNGMSYQLSGMTNDQLPEVMAGVLRQYIADQKAVVEQAAYAASPAGMYDAYLKTGGGDDRQASLADQRAGRDYAASSQLEAATSSDLAQSGSGAGKTKPSEITSAMKTDLAAIAKDSGVAGDNIAKMVASISKGSTHAKQIKEALDEIRSVIAVTFKFTADDPQGLLALIKQLGGGLSLGDAVRANGGRVPGATASGHTASATAD